MAKERLQQVGCAGLMGAVAGAALTAHRGRTAVAIGALAGAALSVWYCRPLGVVVQPRRWALQAS